MLHSSFWLLPTASLATTFTSVIVDDTYAPDAQFIVTDKFNGKDYSIISATQSGNVIWHVANGSLTDPWSSFIIGTAQGAQHGESVDVNADGYADIIISYNYGNCPTNCKSTDGFLGWFENPKVFGKPWKLHKIGKPAFPAHRVVVLNQDKGRDAVRLVSIPISGYTAKGDPFMTPMSVSAYALPPIDQLDQLSSWERYEKIVVDDLNLCHEGKPWYYQNSSGIGLACLQGGVYLELDQSYNDLWTKHQVVDQMSFEGQAFDHEHMYSGISSLAQGIIYKNGEITEIIPFIAPFHDGHIGVSIDGIVTMIDYIPGVGHEIRVAERDGINDDIVVGVRQNQTGLFVYSYNETTNSWDKQTISDDAVNFMSIADFDGDGVDDIVTINFGKYKKNSDIVLHLSLSEIDK